MRRVLCFLTQHQWSASGECLRCAVHCQHAITFYQSETRSTRCLDCGAEAVTAQSHSLGARVEGRPPRNLWQSIRHSVDHFFEADNE